MVFPLQVSLNPTHVFFAILLRETAVLKSTRIFGKICLTLCIQKYQQIWLICVLLKLFTQCFVNSVTIACFRKKCFENIRFDASVLYYKDQ